MASFAHRPRPAHRASQIALRLERTPRFLQPANPASNGGADRARTDDLRLARAALSQLSYSPASLVHQPSGLIAPTSGRLPGRRPAARMMVGLGRFELPTSRLSGVRSNQL